MTGVPAFPNPPVVELVLGAQFSPLPKFTGGHFGLFWNDLRNDWTEPGDGPPIEDQLELFDRPGGPVPAGLMLRLGSVPFPGRFVVGNNAGDRLLQIQSTRFLLNWRRRGGHYPSYTQLITEFEQMFARFTAFTGREGLGPLAVNQWELTYVDAFPRGEYWSTPADWSEFLPGLFGRPFPSGDLGAELELERRVAEWTYQIRPQRGRLHITTSTGRVEGDERELLLLQMTARGAVGKGGVESLRAGLDLGHAVALNAFLQVASEEAKIRWRQRA